MTATERLRTERAFHDRQALERAVTFRRQPERLRVDDEAYLSHETWIRPAVQRLFPLAGCRTLDYGCGHGMAAVVFARLGADVTAFDISAGYLAEAKARARANDVCIDFVQANGERLPFADRTFDRIWGNAVLHHLDLQTSAREIYRVLQPNGVAVFCEPLAGNPLLNRLRRRVSRSTDKHTPHEKPFRMSELHSLRHIFGSVEISCFQLLGMSRRFVKSRPVVAGLDWCDETLLSRVPALGRFCRYVVITLRR